MTLAVTFNSLFAEDIKILIIGIYAIVIVALGLWVSRTKKGKEKSTKDYFLAGKALPWWAIGASLIAANISAEQVIGMSGSGFAVGLAIASYEWMAAITLIIVAKYFMPIFIKQGIYTIPEFVEKRFNTNLKTILAVFWIALFIFVNLTSVLFLGGKALNTIFAGDRESSMLIWFIIGLAFFAAAYSIWGGLSSVAWTDVLQVVILVLGGIVITAYALNNITADHGIGNGLAHIYDVANDKFHMILRKENPEFNNLPGIAVIIGGLWIANLYYWGFNQYIIQRALAAKSLREAQRGLAFAAFLKLLIPLIVVIPGIVVYVMWQQNMYGAQHEFSPGENNDGLYPWLINLHIIPEWIKGIIIAALAAAIVSSLASMLNSTATIFTMDIYKPYFDKKASEKKLVNVGRISILAALIIAVLIAPALGSFEQMFQYIQEYTGLVSPGILAVFLMGLFWKRTTTRGAIAGILSSIPVALLLKIPSIFVKYFGDKVDSLKEIVEKGGSLTAGQSHNLQVFLNKKEIFQGYELPFLDQMMYTCIITIVIIIGISLSSRKSGDEKGIDLPRVTFTTGRAFNISAYVILIILVVLYTVFW